MHLHLNYQRFQKKDTHCQAAIHLIRALKLKISASSLLETMQRHPEADSLLSISDSLAKWNIKNVALKVEDNQLDYLPVPFIAHLNSNGGKFVLVRSVNDNINWIDENGTTKVLKKSEFQSQWSRVVLVAEASDLSFERNYRSVRINELITFIKFPLLLFVIALLTLLFVSQQVDAKNKAGVFLPILKLGGVMCASFLLAIETGSNTGFLRTLCRSGQQNSCLEVIASRKSKLFSFLSWSEIGLYYFAGSLLFLFINGHESTNAISLLAWLNLLALPYMVYSLYCQAFILRKWCPLCLTVQAILFSEAATFYLTGYWNQLPNLNGQAFRVILSFGIPTILWHFIKNNLRYDKEARVHKAWLRRLKSNATIFHSLLLQQKKCIQPDPCLGMEIGDPDAKNILIKVSNPYCRPCAKVHNEIKQLLQECSNLKVRIIFTTTNHEQDHRNAPVRHLLAIAENYRQQEFEKALDDWFSGTARNYEYLAKRYPLRIDAKHYKDNVEGMNHWCHLTGIASTPTLFFNNNQLPDIYSISDLKYFLVD